MSKYEKPASWQKEYLIAWMGEDDLQAIQASLGAWLGPIAETLKVQRQYVQVSLICCGDEERTELYRKWLMGQTTYTEDEIEIWHLPLSDTDDIEALDRHIASRMVGRRLPYRSVVTCLLSSCTPAVASVWMTRAVLGYGERLARITNEGGLEAVMSRVQLLNESLPPWWRPGAVQRHATTPWSWPEESILAPEKLPINNFLHESKKRGSRPKGVNVDLLLIADPDEHEQVQSFAQVLHARSDFAKGPLVSFDCRSVPTDDLRIKLFGAESKDVHSVLGLIGQAQGGTLILRNLDALSEVDQRMLLSTLELQVDAFRLIASLSEDPRYATARVNLCEALFERLVVGVLIG